MAKLTDSLKEIAKRFTDITNNDPEEVVRLGYFVQKLKFDWSFMESIICHLKEPWLMDKAIQVMVDAWDKCVDMRDERCYQIVGSMPDLSYDGFGMYETTQPLKMLKYLDLARDLEGVKADELKRRKVDSNFKKKLKQKKGTNSKKPPRPRPRVDIKEATHSFNYKPHNMGKKEIRKRLVGFYNDLKANNKYIVKDTDAEAFMDNFTGVHTKEKIIWTAEYKQLRYLISKLAMAGVLTWNTEKPKPGILQMICIVFQVISNEYHKMENKLGVDRSKYIHDIEVANLNTKIDDTDEGLDPIIRKLISSEAEETIEQGVSDMYSEFQS